MAAVVSATSSGTVATIAPVIYEVTLTADAAIAAEFDPWLARHVEDMVHLPGFLDADIERADPPDDTHVMRVARYRVESRAALERYFAEYAAAMRAAGIERFGERFTATRRVLEPAGDDPSPGTAIQFCGNCETPLRGRYCPVCGQDSYSRVTSIRELMGDFFGEFLNLDSRLAHSLPPLIGRPGVLTKEYLAGRRARYIPPLKLYLFISVAFFFLLSLAWLQPEWLNVNLPNHGAPKVQLSVKDQAKLANTPKWAQTLVQKGMSIRKDPHQFVSTMIGKLPTMMFLLLPLFAFFLKLLYIRRKRYYVEHLIFSLHYHAVVFLAAFVFLIAYALADRYGIAAVTGNAGLVLWIYLTLYLILAMRKVYAQGWIKTFFKWFVLALCYGLTMSLALAGTVLWAAAMA